MRRHIWQASPQVCQGLMPPSTCWGSSARVGMTMMARGTHCCAQAIGTAWHATERSSTSGNRPSATHNVSYPDRSKEVVLLYALLARLTFPAPGIPWNHMPYPSVHTAKGGTTMPRRLHLEFDLPDEVATQLREEEMAL